MKRDHARNGKHAMGSLLTILFLLSASYLQAKEIHKWTDENGVVHFSDIPQGAHETQSVEIPDPVTLPAAENTANATSDPGSPSPDDESLCADHQARLDTMLRNRNVNYFDDTGVRRELSDEQYESLIEESRNYLELGCS